MDPNTCEKRSMTQSFPIYGQFERSFESHCERNERSDCSAAIPNRFQNLRLLRFAITEFTIFPKIAQVSRLCLTLGHERDARAIEIT